jgi:putative ABC transport system permease protein
MVACPGVTDGSGYCGMGAQIRPKDACPYDAVMRLGGLTTQQMRDARADPRCAHPFQGDGGTVVDDGTALGILTGAEPDDLARATAMLRAGGVVVRSPSVIKDGRVTFKILDSTKQDLSKVQGDPNDNAPTLELPGYLLTTGVTKGATILSPGAVAKAGLTSVPNMLVASTTRMPTATEEERAQGLLQPYRTYAQVEHGAPTQTDPRLWILMGAAAAITLGAAGIGTGLAAADGRQDLSTLAAVGASPRLRRGLSLSQSGVIAGLGSILGSIAGVGAAIAILVALNQRYVDVWPGPTPLPIVLPWLSLGVALLVVPALAMLGAGSLTRSRLPIERRL